MPLIDVLGILESIWDHSLEPAMSLIIRIVLPLIYIIWPISKNSETIEKSNSQHCSNHLWKHHQETTLK